MYLLFGTLDLVLIANSGTQSRVSVSERELCTWIQGNVDFEILLFGTLDLILLANSGTQPRVSVSGRELCTWKQANVDFEILLFGTLDLIRLANSETQSRVSVSGREACTQGLMGLLPWHAGYRTGSQFWDSISSIGLRVGLRCRGN